MKKQPTTSSLYKVEAQKRIGALLTASIVLENATFRLNRMTKDAYALPPDDRTTLDGVADTVEAEIQRIRSRIAGISRLNSLTPAELDEAEEFIRLELLGR